MNKKTISLAILSVIAISILAGCIGPSPNTESSAGTNPLSAKSADWCKAGTKSEVTLPTGIQKSEIIGLVKYDDNEVCQTDIKMRSSTGEEITTTYYVSEDGSYTHVISKDATGKVVYEGSQSVPK